MRVDPAAFAIIVMGGAKIAFGAGSSRFLRPSQSLFSERATRGWNAAESGDCPLPVNGRWCQVHVTGHEPFSMATYATNDVVSDQVCKLGYWELQDASSLGPPGNALDIGANIGYYSLFLARTGWTVSAFEPTEQNLALFNASLCRNPDLASRITVNPYGLGAKAETCTFASPPTNEGDAVTLCGDEVWNAPLGLTLRGEFEIRRLDDALTAARETRIDFMKLDVEGHECNVLAGAPDLLQKFHPRLIQSEVWMAMKGCTADKYLQRFTEAGYTVAKDVACTTPDSSIVRPINEFYMCAH